MHFIFTGHTEPLGPGRQVWLWDGENEALLLPRVVATLFITLWTVCHESTVCNLQRGQLTFIYASPLPVITLFAAVPGKDFIRARTLLPHRQCCPPAGAPASSPGRLSAAQANQEAGLGLLGPSVSLLVGPPCSKSHKVKRDKRKGDLSNLSSEAEAQMEM